jgi:hypothetical protein
MVGQVWKLAASRDYSNGHGSGRYFVSGCSFSSFQFTSDISMLSIGPYVVKKLSITC